MKHPLVRVLAGYAVAAVLATLATWARYLFADPQDVNASSGMWAFGDLLAWGGVFTLAGALPTWWLLGWCRAQGARWDTPALLVLLLSLSAPLAIAFRYTPLRRFHDFEILAVLFQLAAPAFALAIGIAWLNAPTARSRTWLLWAGLMQLACAVSFPLQLALTRR